MATPEPAKSVDDLIYGDARRLDEIWYELGDIYDVKNSIILVAITFLGAIAATVLSSPQASNWSRWVEGVAVVALGFGAFFCIRALWPRSFRVPPAPEEWQKFRRGTTAEDFARSWMDATVERASKNRDAASKKLALMRWSLRMVVAAFVADAVMLIGLALPSLTRLRP